MGLSMKKISGYKSYKKITFIDIDFLTQPITREGHGYINWVCFEIETLSMRGYKEETLSVTLERRRGRKNTW